MRDKESFAYKNRKALRVLVAQGLAILLVAYTLVVIAVYSVPHLPLANGRTFHALLRAQMTVDHAEVLREEDKGLLLFLGSSVVERGVTESHMDSLLHANGLKNLETSNSGNGGFFARANLPMFRAMLERGLRPERVVYGFFLQELNGKSNVHNNIADEDTSDVKLKEKSLLNVIRYGPLALSPLLKGPTFHIYIFAANNAFREVHDPNALDKLMFGDNLFERDSSYELNREYARDLEEIYLLCKTRGIPFALFNTPVRPLIESPADLPYHRRRDNYTAVYEIAQRHNIPIWNYDSPDKFAPEDFQDTYHLTPSGAERLTRCLFEDVQAWMTGEVRQDAPTTLQD